MNRIILMIACLFYTISFADEPKISHDQQELNYGYTYLYSNLKSFAWTDEIMKVKKESEEVNVIGKDIGKTCGKLVEKLKSLQKDYPNLKFDETGQPEAVEAKKKQIKKEKIMKFLPMIGQKGVEFERTLLIQSQGGLDDLRILTEVLLDMEKNEGLKKVLSHTHDELERLYNRIDKLLNKTYFK